jgi:branched-chain amino acid transport system substrate-binding protein
MIVMTAATSNIPRRSPYIARVSFTLAQHAAGIADWAAKQGVKSVFTLYADYSPGRDANAAFK